MKKYVLISAVESLLGVSQGSLRYIEKKYPSIKVSKIRGIRYYKTDDVKKIAKFLGKEADAPNLDAHFAPKTEKSNKVILGATNVMPKQAVVKIQAVSGESGCHAGLDPASSATSYEQGEFKIVAVTQNLNVIPDQVRDDVLDTKKPNKVSEKKVIENKYKVSQLSFFDNFGPPKPQAPSPKRIDTTTLNEYKEKLIILRNRLEALVK